jgi:hypothetical protein
MTKHELQAWCEHRYPRVLAALLRTELILLDDYTQRHK